MNLRRGVLYREQHGIFCGYGPSEAVAKQALYACRYGNSYARKPTTLTTTLNAALEFGGTPFIVGKSCVEHYCSLSYVKPKIGLQY